MSLLSRLSNESQRRKIASWTCMSAIYARNLATARNSSARSGGLVMPLPATIRLYPARSLRLAVFIAMVSILTLSFLIFQQISLHLERKRFDPVFDRLDQLQMETSIRIFGTSGSAELQRYLKHLDEISGGARHYLLNAKGIDLVTAQDHSDFLPLPPARTWRIRVD